MKRSSKSWCALLCLFLGGCARPDVPKGLSAASEAIRQASGAQVLVRMDSSIVRGELLAVEPDTLFLIHGDSLCAVPRSNAPDVKVFLQEYPLTSGSIAATTLLGTLFTVTNGFGLIITAPLWIITGTVTGIVAAPEANNGDFHYPGGPWHGLCKFARFPQGLPQGVPRERLTTAK